MDLPKELDIGSATVAQTSDEMQLSKQDLLNYELLCSITEKRFKALKEQMVLQGKHLSCQNFKYSPITLKNDSTERAQR